MLMAIVLTIINIICLCVGFMGGALWMVERGEQNE